MAELIEKINNKISFTPVGEFAFDAEYDIVIAGLGTAGAISAITGAEAGKKILAAERFTAPGGTVTVGGAGVYYFGGRGGVYEAVDSEQINSPVRLAKTRYPNTDHKKYILDKFLDHENISVMYESVITGIYTEGRRITGVRIFSGGVHENIGLKMLIDSTGEGDICDMAGCSMSFGREGDNSPMPYTIVKSYIRQGMVTKTNHDSSKTDQRDIKAFSKSVIKSYAEFCESGEDEFILKLQPLPGLREGRLLNGVEKIRFSDALDERVTDEPVIYAYADFDKHGCDIAFDSKLFVKWHMLANLGALNVTVPVPKGALIAKEYDNLLVSGRCLSVDHEAATLVRMMRDMQKLGEVSAQMAAIAIDDGVPVCDISYEKLKAVLEKSGCLSEENNKGFRYDHRIPAPDYIKDAVWLTDENEINEALATFSPGLAVWSVRLMGNKAAEFLIKNLKSENDCLKKHSALALAVIDRSEGAEVLRQIVSMRDRAFLKDMRKNNVCHMSQALCALGIIRDVDSIDVIKELICDRKEHTYYESQKGFNKSYYIVLSSAVAALLEISRSCPKRKDEIMSFLENQLSDLKYIREITDKDENSSEYIEAKELSRRVVKLF